MVWVEVNLAAIRHNAREVRRVVGDRVKILAVVKADGYGHGLVEPARALLTEGVWGLGVTRLEDAARLREASIEAPTLVFNSSLPEDAPLVVEYGLDQTVCNMELAQALSDAASAVGKTARAHVKIDTGMGRLGVAPEQAVEYIKTISALPALEIAGVYTHFATAADRNKALCVRQMRAFDGTLHNLKSHGIGYSSAHAAASAAILAMPDSHYDMVRPGTLLYGQYPSAYVPRSLDLRNTWVLKARVAFVKTVAAGSCIGYGAEYRARRDLRIAVLPIGYADGLTLLPESVLRRTVAARFARRYLPGEPPMLQVSIHSHPAPCVGRVAMEMLTVDVTDIPGVKVGDEAVIPCRRTSASSRIPRIYV